LSSRVVHQELAKSLPKRSLKWVPGSSWSRATSPAQTRAWCGSVEAARPRRPHDAAGPALRTTFPGRTSGRIPGCHPLFAATATTTHGGVAVHQRQAISGRTKAALAAAKARGARRSSSSSTRCPAARRRGLEWLSPPTFLNLFGKGQFEPRSGMSDQDAHVAVAAASVPYPLGTHSTSRMNSEGVPWLLSPLTVRKYLRSLGG
jgi:hypothetical protein